MFLIKYVDALALKWAYKWPCFPIVGQKSIQVMMFLFFFGMEMKPNREEHKTFGSIPWNLFRMNWSKNEVNHHGCQPVSNEVGRCHVVEPIHINNMHKKNKLHDGNDVMIFFRHKKKQTRQRTQVMSAPCAVIFFLYCVTTPIKNLDRCLFQNIHHLNIFICMVTSP